jgi:hypothetical protein
VKRLLILGLLFIGLAGAAHAQLQPIPLQACGPTGACLMGGDKFSGVSITWQSATSARYFMVFDADSVPASGATTLCSAKSFDGCLAYCLYLTESTTAPGRFALDWTLHPVAMRFGTVVALSTDTSCGSYTGDGNNEYFFSQTR